MFYEIPASFTQWDDCLLGLMDQGQPPYFTPAYGGPALFSTHVPSSFVLQHLPQIPRLVTANFLACCVLVCHIPLRNQGVMSISGYQPLT